MLPILFGNSKLNSMRATSVSKSKWSKAGFKQVVPTNKFSVGKLFIRQVDLFLNFQNVSIWVIGAVKQEATIPDKKMLQ